MHYWPKTFTNSLSEEMSPFQNMHCWLLNTLGKHTSSQRKQSFNSCARQKSSVQCNVHLTDMWICIQGPGGTMPSGRQCSEEVRRLAMTWTSLCAYSSNCNGASSVTVVICSSVKPEPLWLNQSTCLCKVELWYSDLNPDHWWRPVDPSKSKLGQAWLLRCPLREQM